MYGHEKFIVTVPTHCIHWWFSGFCQPEHLQLYPWSKVMEHTRTPAPLLLLQVNGTYRVLQHGPEYTPRRMQPYPAPSLQTHSHSKTRLQLQHSVCYGQSATFWLKYQLPSQQCTRQLLWILHHPKIMWLTTRRIRLIAPLYKQDASLAFSEACSVPWPPHQLAMAHWAGAHSSRALKSARLPHFGWLTSWRAPLKCLFVWPEAFHRETAYLFQIWPLFQSQWIRLHRSYNKHQLWKLVRLMASVYTTFWDG